MKKNLLLTTTLVAFALPAYAEYSYNEDTKTHHYSDEVVENKVNDGNGGVLLVTNSENLEAYKTTFKNNTSTLQGGVFTLGTAGGEITTEDSYFIGNTADTGGAISVYSKLEIKNTVFDSNTATAVEYDNGGGALFLGAVSSSQIISNSVFENNTSNTKGGAIATRESKYGSSYRDLSKAYLTINADFINNSAQTDGGAIHNYFYAGENGVTVTGDFTSNSAGNNGGAIYNDGQRDKYTSKTKKGGNNAKMTISNSKFVSNSAGNNGGAIYNDGKLDINNIGAKMTIVDSEFTSNIATLGGAIYNDENAVLNLNGSNVFSSNKTHDGAFNDIHNNGAISVSGELTLDGGISGEGTTTIASGSTLTVQANKTTITNKVINEGAKISMIFDTGFEGEYDLITENGALDEEFEILSNTLYDITSVENGLYNIVKKSTSEVAENLGSSSSEAEALMSAISNKSDNQYFNDVADALNAAVQNGDATAVKEAQKLGSDANPIVQAQETSSHEVLFGVVSNELNGVGGAIAEGKSSGDVFKKASAWIRGLFNKADHEATSKTSGFNADSYGVAMGIDKEVNSNTRLGFGYANSQTDIESDSRDTDVDTNSLFAYAKYKQADWYVDTILAYSWSEYDETKSVMGANAGAKYDVDTIALQSMYGYETKFKGHDVTPEFGFRYLHINQEAYTDRLGTLIGSNQEDVLSLVAGAKVAKDYTLDNGLVLRPEVKAAVTYDLFDADNSANVTLANGAGYVVDGEKLNRLGFEFGAKVTTKAADKVEVSAGYLTRVREDYQDHTITLDARYNF